MYCETIWSSGEYSRISLIAHSWGAFVGISLLDSFGVKLHKVVLLAPLTFVPPLEMIAEDLRAFIETQKAIGRPASIQRLLTDFEKLKDLAETTVQNPKFSNWPETLVIQGTHDSVTPAEMNRTYFAAAGENVRFVEALDNHWLTNRAELATQVVDFLKIGRR